MNPKKQSTYSVSRQVSRRMAYLVRKRAKYEDSGFDRTAITYAGASAGRSAYMPHQNKREMERRAAQVARKAAGDNRAARWCDRMLADLPN